MHIGANFLRQMEHYQTTCMRVKKEVGFPFGNTQLWQPPYL